MRTCKTCGIQKPDSAFEKVARWRRGTCRQCRADYVKQWNEKSRVQIRQNRQTYYKQHKTEIISKVTEWVKQNPEKRRKNALAYYYRLQEEVILAYGGYKCACCGETEPLFMTLDHTNNDGRNHRKEIGTLGGHKLYKWLKDHGYPPGFQVLCMNCNHGKYRNKGICPHRQA